MATSQSDLERWRGEAQSAGGTDPSSLKMPLHAFFGDAVDVARFCRTYWKPVVEKGVIVRRGIESAAGLKSRLYPAIADDILSLQRAAQEAQTQYLLVIDPSASGSALDRGRFLLNEITAALEWYFEDGIEDENDAKLARIQAAHADDPYTMDALASALDDYAGLAEPHRDSLHGLGGFESSYLDEARTLGAALRERPAVAVVMSDAARQAITLRNQILSLLADRMAIVRSAARFVFRDDPEIVRQVTSAYERRKRAATRRAQAQEAAEEAAKKAEDAKKAEEAKRALKPSP